MSLNSVRTEFGSTNRGYLNLTCLRQGGLTKTLDKFLARDSEFDMSRSWMSATHARIAGNCFRTTRRWRAMVSVASIEPERS